MLHPYLTPVASNQKWLAQVGPFGAWDDLTFTVRYGDGPCGLFEASWSMPLPARFDDPALTRGTKVELMQGPWRFGSSLYVTDVERGDGYGSPWKVTAAGLGRAATSGFVTLDEDGKLTAIPSVAALAAAGRGWGIAAVDASVSSVAFGQDPPDAVNSTGNLLSDSSTTDGKRWGVGQDNVLRFYDAPVGPEYQTAPGVAGLGVSDDSFTTLLFFRYLDASTGTYQTATAPSTPPRVADLYGHKEEVLDGTSLGPLDATTAQAFADSVFERTGGQLSWLSTLTLTRNDVTTFGGGPVDLLKFAEDAGRGVMLRIHGVWSDLLAFTGKTYLDVIVGEVKKDDATDAITVSPLGLSPRTVADVFESITRNAA